MGLRGGRAEGTESGGWKIEDGDGKVGRVPLCFHRAIIKPLPWGRCVVIIPLSSSTSFIFVFLSHLSFLYLLFFLFPLFFFFLARLCMRAHEEKKEGK